MSEDSRFKVSLPFHPAFKSTVPVPVALLKHFRDVGLTVHTLVYTLQAFAVYMNGGEISHFEIASRMGVDERIIKRYSQQMRDAGLLVVNPQLSWRGKQAANDYDFSPLLDAVMEFQQTYEDERFVGEAEMRQVLAELVYALENSLPLNDILRTRVLALVGRGDQTIPPMGDQTIPPRGDQTIPPMGDQTIPPMGDQTIPPGVIKRSPLLPPVEGGSNDPPYDDDDLLSSSAFENHHHQSSEGNNPISALVSIGFTKVDASLLVYKVMPVFGDLLSEVVLGWVAYARENKRVLNPPGFVRVKLERGEHPPAPLEQIGTKACPDCARLLVNGRCLFCEGVVKT